MTTITTTATTQATAAMLIKEISTLTAHFRFMLFFFALPSYDGHITFPDFQAFFLHPKHPLFSDHFCCTQLAYLVALIFNTKYRETWHQFQRKHRQSIDILRLLHKKNPTSGIKNGQELKRGAHRYNKAHTRTNKLLWTDRPEEVNQPNTPDHQTREFSAVKIGVKHYHRPTKRIEYVRWDRRHRH